MPTQYVEFHGNEHWPTRFPTFKETDSSKKLALYGLIDAKKLADFIRTKLEEKLKGFAPGSKINNDFIQGLMLEIMEDKILKKGLYFDAIVSHSRTETLFKDCAILLAQQCNGALDCGQKKYYSLLENAHKQLEEIYKAKKEGKLFDTERVLAYAKDKTPRLPKISNPEKLAKEICKKFTSENGFISSTPKGFDKDIKKINKITTELLVNHFKEYGILPFALYTPSDKFSNKIVQRTAKILIKQLRVHSAGDTLPLLKENDKNKLLTALGEAFENARQTINKKTSGQIASMNDLLGGDSSEATTPAFLDDYIKARANNPTALNKLDAYLEGIATGAIDPANGPR